MQIKELAFLLIYYVVTSHKPIFAVNGKINWIFVSTEVDKQL